MDFFNQYAISVLSKLEQHDRTDISNDGETWPTIDRSPYVMERDTSLELGGYPKESISLLLACSSELAPRIRGGISLIRNGGAEKERHRSFGKIILVEADVSDKDQAYEFMQSLKMADIRMQFKDIMLRSSTEQYFTNLRISKQALKAGFSIDRIGRTIYRTFSKLPEVKKAEVILLEGDLPLYKELLPIADSLHKATAAMNKIFDGVEMSCASCNLQTICSEVEGLRELHQAKIREKDLY